jgi:SAM-dependent methyltransferase
MPLLQSRRMSTGLTCADPILDRGSRQPLVVGDPWKANSRPSFEFSPVYDQWRVWEELHHLYSPLQQRASATSLARGFSRRLSPPQRVLELGCGNGADAAFLNRCGHAVVATDFSGYAIDTAGRNYQGKDLVFLEQDLRKPFAFGPEEFDAVYARLSLHYFSDAITRSIVDEVGRILAPGGLFLFMCKSTQDSLYGKGELIAPRTYCYEGHVRHFFDITYAKDLLTLEGFFDVVQLHEAGRNVYGTRSSVIICLAKRVLRYRQPRLF